MDHLLVMADRERAGREASHSAAVIDSQSVRTTKAVVLGSIMLARCANWRST
jgi:ABC-type enterochelin transport system substrate-binding protein